MKNDKGQKVTLTSASGRAVPLRVEVNRRARRLILRIDPKRGEAVAVAPNKRLLGEAAAFAADRVEWICAQLERSPETSPFVEGAQIPIRGVSHRLSSSGEGRLARLEASKTAQLIAPGDPETFGLRVTRFLKKEARIDLEASVARNAATLGVKPARIVLKDTRSRWGSCSAAGNLNFSWRLICAPPDVLDYVAAHECAHLIEMNHSPAFWAQVEKCRPDWKVQRNWLRTHGGALHALGAD